MSEDTATDGDSGLTVYGHAGEHVEVMHGDRCVAFTLSDGGGAFLGGIVLTPTAARSLAVLLEKQAAAA